MTIHISPEPDVQPKVSELILKILEKNTNIPQTILFYGEEGTGKFFYGIHFIKSLFCVSDIKPCNTCSQCVRINSNNHPDVKLIHPEPYNSEFGIEKLKNPFNAVKLRNSDLIKIDKIRELKEFVLSKIFEDRYRIIFINNFDRTNQQGSNAFLKLLEEPDKDTIILLTSASTRSILPTILSRIQMKIHFPPLTPSALKEIFTTKGGVDIKQVDFEDYTSYIKLADDFVSTDDFVEGILKGTMNILVRLYETKDEILMHKNVYGFYKKILNAKGSSDSITKNYDRACVETIINKLYDISHKIIILAEERKHPEFAKMLRELGKMIQIRFLSELDDARKMLFSNVNPAAVFEVLIFKLCTIVINTDRTKESSVERFYCG